MASSTTDLKIVQVSQKGQATIPKPLREKFGINTPGEVFIYEEGDRIIVEPVPSMEDLHGIHAGEHEPGEVLERARELADEEQNQEEARARELVERHGQRTEDGAVETEHENGSDG